MFGSCDHYWRVFQHKMQFPWTRQYWHILYALSSQHSCLSYMIGQQWSCRIMHPIIFFVTIIANHQPSNWSFDCRPTDWYFVPDTQRYQACHYCDYWFHTIFLNVSGQGYYNICKFSLHSKTLSAKSMKQYLKQYPPGSLRSTGRLAWVYFQFIAS